LDFSIAYGLASALSYGAGDFASQIAGRAIGVWRATFYYYLLGFAALSGWLISRADSWGAIQSVSPYVWVWSVASGLALLAAVVLFTQGLIKGRIEVVVPVMASYGAVTTLLALATGELLSWTAILGIALVVVGACLIAVPSAEARTSGTGSGIGWAVGAALAYGTGFWIQGAFAVPALGPLIPVCVVYATGLVVFGIAQRLRIVNLGLPHPFSLVMPAVAASVCSVIGFVTLTSGVSTGHTAVVVVLSSLSSAVTVLIACSVRRMRLELHQWLALVSVVAGLAVIRIPVSQS
jgi:drug/metabolite transporter (DMT)-like permease